MHTARICLHPVNVFVLCFNFISTVNVTTSRYTFIHKDLKVCTESLYLSALMNFALRSMLRYGQLGILNQPESLSIFRQHRKYQQFPFSSVSLFSFFFCCPALANKTPTAHIRRQILTQLNRYSFRRTRFPRKLNFLATSALSLHFR